MVIRFVDFRAPTTSPTFFFQTVQGKFRHWTSAGQCRRVEFVVACNYIGVSWMNHLEHLNAPSFSHMPSGPPRSCGQDPPKQCELWAQKRSSNTRWFTVHFQHESFGFWAVHWCSYDSWYFLCCFPERTFYLPFWYPEYSLVFYISGLFFQPRKWPALRRRSGPFNDAPPRYHGARHSMADKKRCTSSANLSHHLHSSNLMPYSDSICMYLYGNHFWFGQL